MSAHTKIGGAWKDVAEIHCRVGGTWQEVTEGHTKISGAWKQFYANEIPPFDVDYLVIAGGGSGNSSNGGGVAVVVTGLARVLLAGEHQQKRY